MATVTLKNALHIPQGDLNSYFGNVTKKLYHFETNSSGITVTPSSDKATAIGIGDVIRLGVIKAGSTLLDSTTFISDASTAAVTGTLGFQYVDGVDDSAVPQDADFFYASLALSSTGVSRKTNVTPPVTIPKDAYLILTSGVAAHDSACVIDIVIETIGTGADH